MPGDFDIYDAFDECGNPPIHLWSRYLRAAVPSNWFLMFEEAKRKRSEWSMRQSMVQQHQNHEYYYAPSHEKDSQVNGSTVHNHDMPSYSNTDVSSMHLNNNDNTASNTIDNTTTSPSVIASTNIVDPNMMEEEGMSTINNYHQEPSANNSTVSVNNSQPDCNNTGRQMMSPSPSYQGQAVRQPDRTNSIMDREQIRKHIAPGRATLTSRNSSSVITLDSSLNQSTINSPKLVYHQSKEYVTNGTPIPLTSSPTATTPPSDNAVSSFVYNNQDLTSKLMESSSMSTEVDFPHDSDKYSIRSDIPSTTASPTILPSTSSKSCNRPSMKKIIWG